MSDNNTGYLPSDCTVHEGNGKVVKARQEMHMKCRLISFVGDNSRDDYHLNTSLEIIVMMAIT